ncbi:unnamed protein product [Caenorhabditis angaria]|uniref:C-type lectin domain-containing protein n=1 Tax=Caenorhabditis angaria TaxID=860376 RepID=A0A9P1IKS2_9PELO|nr:unnamed protein product [Caenorhabditis angaria]
MYLSIFLVGLSSACIRTDNSVPIVPEDTTTTTTTTTTTEAPPSCPEGWTLFDRTPTPWCMRVSLQSTNIDGALAVCQGLNSAAVVSGFQNQNEITTMMTAAVAQGAAANSNLLVGAKRTEACQDSAITATCTALTSFEWTDPSTTGTDGFQWAAGQPDNFQGTSGSVVINVGTELLDDVNGADTKEGVVCGMNAT